MAQKRTSARFTAPVRKKGVNAYVDVPKDVSAFFSERGNVPVRTRLGRKTFRATLVPVGGGQHILYVNQEMLKAGKLEVGDRSSFVLRRDRQTRMPPMHPVLAAALRKNPTAKRVWEGLTDSRRKEILRYLHAMKRRKSVERNVEKVVRILPGKKQRLPTGM